MRAELKQQLMEAIIDSKTAVVGVFGAAAGAKATAKTKKPVSEAATTTDED